MRACTTTSVLMGRRREGEPGDGPSSDGGDRLVPARGGRPRRRCRRAAVLHGKQPAELLDVEVGVALLAEGEADEHRGRLLGHEHIAVRDHLLGSALP